MHSVVIAELPDEPPLFVLPDADELLEEELLELELELFEAEEAVDTLDERAGVFCTAFIT